MSPPMTTNNGFLNMDSAGKWFSGGIAALIGAMAPISVLVKCAILFTLIDFVVGVWASRVRAKKRGELELWGFESGKAWRTVSKIVFIVAGIVLTYVLDEYIIPLETLYLANFFTAFVCGVEFFSYLENAAEISSHPIFNWLKKYMANKVRKEIDIDFDEIKKGNE